MRVITHCAVAFLYYFYNAFVTHIPLYWVRHCYLRNVLGIKVGKNTAIHMGCFVTGCHIVIGENTVVNRNCHLDGRVGIEIGNRVCLAPETCIISLSHDTGSADFSTKGAPVVLHDYVWTGMRAMLLPGVHMSKGSVAGAGAVVTKSVDEFSIVAGCPAAPVGRRNRDLRYDPSYFPFFNTDILPDR